VAPDRPFFAYYAAWGFLGDTVRTEENFARLTRDPSPVTIGPALLWDGGSYHLWFLPFVCATTVPLRSSDGTPAASGSHKKKKKAKPKAKHARLTVVTPADLSTDVRGLVALGCRDLDDRVVAVVELGAQRPRHHRVHEVEPGDVRELEDLLVGEVAVQLVEHGVWHASALVDEVVGVRQQRPLARVEAIGNLPVGDRSDLLRHELAQRLGVEHEPVHVEDEDLHQVGAALAHLEGPDCEQLTDGSVHAVG